MTHAQFDADPSQVAASALAFNTRKSVHQSQGDAIYEHDLGAGNSLRVLGYIGNRGVQQFLSVPVAAQASPLHSGGVVDLDSDYGGIDARWTWQGELGGRAFEIAAGLAWDSQQQQRRGYTNYIGDVLGVVGALRRNEADTVSDFDQYAQATWHVADAWTLTAGVRHSRVRFDSTDHYITAKNPDDSGRVEYGATTRSPASCVARRAGPTCTRPAARASRRRPSTNSAIEVTATPDSRSISIQPPAATVNSASSCVAPVASRRISRCSTPTPCNELAVATSTGGRTTYQNIGKERRQGAEAALAMRLTDDWKLQVAYTVLDATFRSAFLTCAGSPCTVPNTPVAAGSRIPGIARTDLHAALHWRDIGWRAALQGDYVSAVSVNDLGTDAAPSYVVASIDVGYGFAVSSGQLRTFVRIDNLFNRKYAGSVIVNDANGRYFKPAPDGTLMLGVQWLWML